jgi:shikimate dehydrogenase
MNDVKELKFGLIGSSLSHSKSIKIQNAAFQHLGINASYENFEIPIDNFDRGIIMLLQQVDGLNITIPFKEKIIKYLNRADELVGKIGAANTVHLTEMGIIGYNTDYQGFIDSLKDIKDISNKKVALLGAGGAAKAVLVALEDLGLEKIHIYARNKTKVEDNLPRLNRNLLEIHMLDEATELTGINLLINSTPVGQARLSEQSPIDTNVLETLPKSATVYDLIYSDTKLIQEAKELGLNTINGKEMLVRQAMHSIKHWTKQELTEDLYKVMSKAFDN